MDLLFLNVYSVTRHYGGAAEGGWYFDSGEPLASVPIRAKRIEGHDSVCWNCEMARLGVLNKEGQPYILCKELPEDFDNLSDEEAAQVEANARLVYHLVSENKIEMEAKRTELEEMFADEAYGDIGSVLGGVEIRVALEEHMAAPWPDKTPRYE